MSKPAFSIYNMNTGEHLGTYVGIDKSAALDAMALAYGFRDYTHCIADYGVSIEDAITELQITRAD